MLTEPDLYQQIKAYIGSLNLAVQDSRRQLIGYLLERDKQGLEKITRDTVTHIIPQVVYTKDIESLRVSKKDKVIPSDREKRGSNTSQFKPKSLFDAAATGDLSQLLELLNAIDVHTINSANETLLHIAAEHGHLSIIELLLDRGAQLDISDSEGRTPLHRAAHRGHKNVARALIKAGAPIYNLDKQSNTALHLATINGHLSIVRSLLEEERQGTRRVSKNNQAQGSFLHIAAREDESKLAEVLLQCGAPVDVRDNRKRTALFHAVSQGWERTANILLKAGATVDRTVIDAAIELNNGAMLRLLLGHAGSSLSMEDLVSALFSAVESNLDSVTTAIAESGVDINIRDQQGYTPLLLSVELGHTEAFRSLAAKKAIVDATLPNFSSALHLAAQNGNEIIAQTLLEMGLDPNLPGPKANTPLHLAVQHDRPAIVELLLKAGAQVNPVSQDGLTPLHSASQMGHPDIVNKLLKGKADTGARDKQGRTALHWAATTQGERDVVELLLSAGADPNASDREKKTPLHLAAMDGRVDTVTMLLQVKSRGGAKDMFGSTPLHYAAANGHVRAAAALLSPKNVNDRNVWRKTPLHTASEHGHEGVVGLLLRGGAKINALDNSKDTPLHCAARCSQQCVASVLVGWGAQGHHQGDRANLQARNKVGKTPLQVAEVGGTTEHDHIVTLLKKRMLLIK
ncbi:hypothetical protein UPYG_G00028690 [Umbra pygmaea]|uniref:Uncharacterized protein n=1 Tax=Umbra pygmaea TaxID=75934 RepID=A0ABD0XM89_UMBPY